ncbi:MAG: helix-turn-helix domain-containing protein [Burkholderiales bacterium]|jgi:cytoskeleton protein RodZ|nr:helix-turn-helix domain-containing protein [Burkholderiales bacterium]
MTEPAAPPVPGSSAGALLRAARERQGLHIAALSAAIKIPQRKLEALEADRFDELPDATFTRALAMTVCRALKIDPAPVLSQLPQATGRGLAEVGGGLNTPFRERPGRAEPGDHATRRHPLIWAALGVLLVAAAVVLLPQDWWPAWTADVTTAPVAASAPAAALPASAAVAASAASAGAEAAPAMTLPASAPAVEVVHSAPPAEAASSAASAPGPAAGVAVLRASEASWVEVIDASGQVLVQRVLQPGETLGLDGRLPMRLKIGNAAATQVLFRGQPMELTPFVRDNVARLELK